MKLQSPALGGAAARGVAVLGISQAFKIIGQFASVIILSRLLTPDDFGVTAAVAPLVAFISIFQDFGFQQAIIQKPDISDADLTGIFWMTMALGVSLTAAMMALSPAAAWFYNDQRLLLVTIAAALPMLAYSVLSVPTALLNRQGRFSVLAVNDAMVAIVSLAVALILAEAGLRYWALVLGTLAASAASALFIIRQAGWFPGRPSWTWPETSLLHFGRNLTGNTVLTFFARNADNMLVGHAWGGVELGYYDRAYKLLLLPLQNVSFPVHRVMVPLLSRIETDKPRLRSMYLRAAWQVVLVTVPGMAALVATAPVVIELVFGPRWAPVTPIFFWLGLVGLIQPLNATFGWLFISQAKTKSFFRLGLYQCSISLLSFVAGLHWGAVGVATAYALGEYGLRLPLSYWWVGGVGPVKAADLMLIQGPVLAAAGVTWVIGHALLAGLQGAALIGATIPLSYLSAIAAASCVAPGRSALRESFLLLQGMVRTSSRVLKGKLLSRWAYR